MNIKSDILSNEEKKEDGLERELNNIVWIVRKMEFNC